jgi:hypothetical protein
MPLALRPWAGRIGWARRKWASFADLIAVDGRSLADVTVLERVTFVMQDGQVVKHLGYCVGRPYAALMDGTRN